MTETIKLLELFSGIQSQERALRQLGIPYESIGVCDCDKDVLVASAAMRFDLEKEIVNYDFPDTETMIKELQDKNIGYSFKKQKHTITSRTPIPKLKQYYISDKLLKNLGDISKVERLPRANFVTYSSPCQSFSVAGKLAGAAKTCTKCGHKWDIDFSNPDYNYKCPVCGNASLESTTSGLLQEVQRLLAVAYEENELPEYLMLENVKNLVQKKFIGQFNAWVRWLDSIGYNTYWKVLNAKNYGIPQNRERIFAISIRKDIDTNGFTFPEPIPLTTRLKDILEKSADEKYYLSDDRIDKILNSSFMQEKKQIQTTDVRDTLLARDWKDPKCVPTKEEIQNGYNDKVSIPLKRGYLVDVSTYEPDSTEIDSIGNYSKSDYNATPIVNKNGIAPTVRENHGQVTAIIEPQVVKVGQASTEGSQCGTVYSTDDLAPTLTAGCHGYAMGYIAEEQEPFIVASRGRNPENPSDRTTGAPTEQRLEPNFSGCTNTLTSVQKDNYVCEPQVLRAERTEYGKAIRKQYEAGEVNEKISNMREMKPRTDGVSNTITTLLKDNYVAEPVIIDNIYNSREPRIYSDAAPTLRSQRTGLKVVDEIEYPCSTRGKQVASAIRASIYKQGARNLEENVVNGLGYEGIIEQKSEINPKLVGGIGEKNFGKQYRQGNRVYDSDEIAMTLNAQPVGNAGGYSYLYAVKEEEPKIRWRIRKLTPLECWRLMGFTDKDCNRASSYVSSSALYKQAGNSICTCCLIAIFSSLFLEDGYKSDVWTKYSLNYDD